MESRILHFFGKNKKLGWRNQIPDLSSFRCHQPTPTTNPDNQPRQPNQPTKTMNKAQASADSFINQSSTFQWSDLVAHISKDHAVKNWMTIRSVIQFNLNNGKIARTQNPFIEEYVKLK
jgi:hypothetical protein